MRPLSRTNPLPLYHQLKEELRSLVDDGALKPGDAVPSERELCERHHISRMTVSKAISTLVNEGVLYREQGKGTFVAPPKPSCGFSQLSGFTENMEKAGLPHETRLISFEVEEPSRQLQETLQLSPENHKVFNILRRRFVAGEPFSLEQVWLPVDRAPDLSATLLDGQSLYALLRGAATVMAVDSDLEAVLSARKNLALNGAEGVHLVCADLLDLRGRWNIVLANLDIRTFIRCSSHVKGFVREGGYLLISGILGRDGPALVSLFSDLKLLTTERKNSWRGFLFFNG